MPRWYVVGGGNKPVLALEEKRIWTLSRDPDRDGWDTDMSTDGYGLTWDEATELADAANAAWEKGPRVMPALNGST